MLSKLNELRFFSLKNEQIYTDKKLELTIDQKDLDLERENFYKMMVKTELNE